MTARILFLLVLSGITSPGLAQSFSEASGLFLSFPDASIPFSAFSVADFNGDGRTDIYHPGRLYRQTADGRYENVLSRSGISVEGNGPIVALPGDQNADGILDMVIISAGAGARYYENLDTDRYRLANSDRNLNIQVPGTGGVWGDFDLDGYVDLFVASRDGQNQLYLSAADNLFTNVSATKRSHTPPGGCGLAVTDFDKDGDLDVFTPTCQGGIINGFMDYNPVSDRFDQRAARLGIEGFKFSYSAVWLDYDNDGWQDLFVVNARFDIEDPANNLYRNLNGTGFQDQALSAGVSGNDSNPRRQAAAADFNNDGWTDIYITTDEGADKLYINQQDGTFVDRIRDLIPSRPASDIFSAADVNDDGWIDLLYGSSGGHTLLLNSGDAHWIKVGLRSPGNNRLGLGARVEVRTGSLVQSKVLVPGGGSLVQGQSSDLHFGVGTAETIDEVRVIWPNGATDIVSNLGVDQLWTIAAGGSIDPAPKRFSLLGPPDAAFFDTSAALIALSWEQAIDDPGLTYTVSVVGPGTQLRFPGVATNSVEISTELLAPNQIYSWAVLASDGLSVSPSAERRFFSFGNPDRATATLEAPATFDFGIPPLDSGDARFLDFDGDQDLDLLIVGSDGPAAVARLYRSIDATQTGGGGQFNFKGMVDTGSSLVPVLSPEIAVGDWDGDGDPDAVISGLSAESGLPVVTLYQTGTGALQAIGSVGENLWGGPVSIVDADGDGDGDLLVSGSQSLAPPYDPVTILYRNEGGNFIEWVRFPGAMFGGADWFDADQDGDLDLVLVGQSGPGTATASVFRNEGASFTEIVLPGAGLFHSAATWADFDGDGDGDILISGGELSTELLTGRTMLLRQDSPWSFSEESTALDGVVGGNAVWGDYEEDGDLDIILVGGRSVLGEILGRVYRNQEGRFIAELDFQGTLEGRVAAGDYNLDGDLDFLVLGKDSEGNASVTFFINQQVAEPVPVTR